MGDNDLTNVFENKSIFTVKRILRALSMLCIIFVFCPSFLVSCSGQNINVSVMSAVGGMSAYGEKVVDPYPIMLICFLIPVFILILLLFNKFTDNRTALIVLICTVVNFIIWLIFRASVKKIAEENYCTFKTTGWYVINIIAMLIIVLFSALVVMKKMQMDTDLITGFSGGGTQDAINQMSATVNQISSVVTQFAGNVASNINSGAKKENTIGFCSKCGSPISYGCKFCTSCGTPVPESILAEAEAAKKAAEEVARKEAEEKASLEEEAKRIVERRSIEITKAEQVSQNNNERPMFCQQCGTKLEADAAFCESCGTKVE